MIHWVSSAKHSSRRSRAKTLSYEVLHALITGVCAWGLLIVAGVSLWSSVPYAAGFALLDIIVDTLLYYAHERLWEHLED